MSSVTFVINWVDPIADFVSVTFSTDVNGASWSVPVTKSDPLSWQQAVSDWYSANLAPAEPIEVPAEPLTVLTEPTS